MRGWSIRRTPRLLGVAFGVSLGLCLVGAGTALAYDGYAAARWADSHATSYTCWDPAHPNALPCVDDDCTNFVSNAMAYGGHYSQHIGNGDVNSLSNWSEAKNGLGLWVESRTWIYTSGSPNLYSYQIAHLPGGWLLGTKPGNSYTTYDGLYQGDLLFYDWGDGRGRMHAAIQTTSGEDPNWQNGHTTGDLVDAHQTNHKFAWWTLAPYNPNRNITTIYLVRISSGN